MKKNIILFALFLILLVNGFLQAQQNLFYNYNINNIQTDQLGIPGDIWFKDMNTGYVSAVKYVNSTTCYGYIYKTTNGGINWDKTWYTQLPSIAPQSQVANKLAMSFSNANTNIGYLVKQTDRYHYWKTTDGGNTFNQKDLTTYFSEFASEPVTCVSANNELIIIRKDKPAVYRYNSIVNYGYESNFGPNIALEHIEISKQTNIIYVGGRNINTGYPFLAKSTTDGYTYSIIPQFDGNTAYDNAQTIKHISIVNNGTGDILKLSCDFWLLDYNTSTNSVTYLTDNWSGDNKICFSDIIHGFYLKKDALIENDEYSVINNVELYKTSNNGQNWILDYTLNNFSSASYPSRFFTYGQCVYLTNFLAPQFSFVKRKLGYGIATYYDDLSTSGRIFINNNQVNTPQSIIFDYSTISLYSDSKINEYADNEKIFYKWNNNTFNNSINSVDLHYDGIITNHFKTRHISTEAIAISNSNQTKALRLTNGSTPMVHSSIGGIFYSQSSSPNVGFDFETVVNGGQEYAQLPNSNTADNNKNPSLNEIKFFSTGDNGGTPAVLTMASVWERRDLNSNNTDILCALGTTTGGYNLWTRYGNNLSALDGKITTFSTPVNFNSKSDIYSIFCGADNTDVTDFLMVIPHLEPTSNGRLVVSVRYKNLPGFDNEALRIEDIENYETRDYKVIKENVSDYSVTYNPVLIGNFKGVYLYFTYKKNGNIYYQRDLIYLNSSLNQIIREEVPIGEREYCVSDGDLQSQRNTPDITLRNGMPTISYQGMNNMTREIVYEGTSETENMLLHYYPIKIRMRNSAGNWIGFDYNSNGIQTQENPDIEGSTDFDAFIVNFSKANTTFFQFVKINSLLYSGYSCSPGSFIGTDAKLIKGSYSGALGVDSKPGLLTLSNPVNSLYTVGKQNFIITNTAVYDGFSNLDGTIIKDNTEYAFTLGPIIASNTTSGFSDDTPPQTVHNAVEFNETMKSAVFSLSNNDTLILGANGRYLTVVSQVIQPIPYHVNLVNSTTGQIHRELFRDTINTEDSVGIEFLRGYVINDIAAGIDQFYVQLLIDTVSGGDGDYLLTGVYPDNSSAGLDAQKNYRTRIRFDNLLEPMNSGTNIPKNYELFQNYPNPFNPSTKIAFDLPKDAKVKLVIYNILGREIKTLIHNEFRAAGKYITEFNGSNLASGVYFYRLQAGDFVSVKKMVLIK